MTDKVNLRPDSFSEGGGLIDDFDGTINDIRFIMTTYDGAISESVCVACVAYLVDGEDAGTDLLSVGGKNDFAPDETGMGLIKLKGRDMLTKRSKFGMFLNALVEVGFPIPKMDPENISYLNGFEGHFLRKPVEFKGIAKKGDREDTVLLCTKIIKLPWEATKGKGKGKGKGKPTEGDATLATSLTGIIQKVLIDADGSISKKDLLSGLFKNDDIAELPGRKAALKLATDDTYLNSRDEWEYADGVLKMG